MGAYIVKCESVEKNPDGSIAAIHCTADLETGNGLSLIHISLWKRGHSQGMIKLSFSTPADFAHSTRCWSIRCV